MHGVPEAPDQDPVAISIERPVLYAQIGINQAEPTCLLHVTAVHLKSKIPSETPGQVIAPLVLLVLR